ncbi:MAG: hypothetical protein VW239_10220, partial [Candidatus Nanopelagicales bacterium]
ATKNDPEIGGANLQTTLADAKAFLDVVGTPGLREVMDSTRVGNHPEIVRAFAKAGKLLRDAGMVVTGKEPTKPRDAASILYPDMPQ